MPRGKTPQVQLLPPFHYLDGHRRLCLLCCVEVSSWAAFMAHLQAEHPGFLAYLRKTAHYYTPRASYVRRRKKTPP